MKTLVYLFLFCGMYGGRGGSGAAMGMGDPGQLICGFGVIDAVAYLKPMT